MIPKSTGVLSNTLQLERQPSLTYGMDIEQGRIMGWADKLVAMKQAVYKMINTERYRYAIYSWNYGIETQDLFGQLVSYVCPELERRVREALGQDERIWEVKNFTFDTSAHGTVKASFFVVTQYGEFAAEREVSI